jgi:hypothetical protein
MMRWWSLEECRWVHRDDDEADPMPVAVPAQDSVVDLAGSSVPSVPATGQGVLAGRP